MGLRASACYFGNAVKIDAYSGPENNLGAGAFYTLLELTLTYFALVIWIFLPLVLLFGSGMIY